MTTVLEATNAFLSNIQKSKSPRTYRAYSHALLGRKNGFISKIAKAIKPEDPIDRLNEKHAMQYMQDILGMAPATRQLNAAAIRRFYTFIAGNDWATVSLDRLNFLFEGSNVLTPVKSEIRYDKAAINAFMEAVYAWDAKGNTPTRDIRNLRDKAFVITLAESGLRVHEACKIRIKDLDLDTEAGVVKGKGSKQARFKIGHVALQAIRAYWDARAKVIPLAPDQPVFIRHDKKAGAYRALPMDTQSGEDIIHHMEMRLLGTQTLTCHTLRHHFVTKVLLRSKNLKAAQLLARHTNINITERYAHLVNEDVDREFDAAVNQ